MIHCVLKPEKNKDANDGDNVKLIDFRCVVFNDYQVNTYIQ